MLALVGVFYPYNRGALFTALVVIYALTSGVAGYTAASFYCQLEGTNWVCIHSLIAVVWLLWKYYFTPRHTEGHAVFFLLWYHDATFFNVLFSILLNSLLEFKVLKILVCSILTHPRLYYVSGGKKA